MQAIHILGASGSGTSTLGKALSERFGCAWIDTDSIYWEQTDPPFQVSRPFGERVRMIEEAMRANPRCVISGWMGSAGDAFLSRFNLIIWLHVPTELRIRRLRAREATRFGLRILPGGDMYETHQAFLDYAGQYDEGGMDIRSYARQKKWLEQAACPMLELDGARGLEELVAEVALWLSSKRPVFALQPPELRISFVIRS